MPVGEATPEEPRPASTALSFVAWGVAWYLVAYLVTSVIYVGAMVEELGARLLAVALARPLVAAAMAAAAAFALWTRRDGPRWLTPAAATLSVLALVLHRPGRGGMLGDYARDYLTTVLLSALLFALWWSLPRLRRARRAVPLAAALSLAGLVGTAALPGRSSRATNGLGLVAGSPGSVQRVDYRGDSSKDDYPVCVFRYNSLGFRDAEPPPPRPGVFRVLLIGDSYVWGDGIPDGAQTLGARLRSDLDASEPGAYVVMSAAYPGLGLYGYAAYLRALAPRLEPDLVIVGYLGSADLDPADPQLLVDRLPRSPFLRRLFDHLHVLQNVHETAVRERAALWSRPDNAARMGRVVEGMAAWAGESDGALVFLHYWGGADDRPPIPLPQSVGRVFLPEELRYPGESSRYWYGRDAHPRPLLDERIAELLVPVVVAARRASAP